MYFQRFYRYHYSRSNLSDMNSEFLNQSKALFRYYRQLGEKALIQTDDTDLFVKYYSDGNSIANIVKHLAGNMKSRWTDFLTSDGEKNWRNRDGEFEDTLENRADVMNAWRSGWAVFEDALAELTPEDMMRKVVIRGESHDVFQAILRQLAHYASHIGQIVFIARNLAGERWTSLSIPKGESVAYNEKHQGRLKDSKESLWER